MKKFNQFESLHLSITSTQWTGRRRICVPFFLYAIEIFEIIWIFSRKFMWFYFIRSLGISCIHSILASFAYWNWLRNVQRFLSFFIFVYFFSFGFFFVDQFFLIKPHLICYKVDFLLFTIRCWMTICQCVCMLV